MKLLELTLQNFQCLSGITKIQFSKNPSRNISLAVSQDTEEAYTIIEALEWVLLFSAIYTNEWKLSSAIHNQIDQLHKKINQSAKELPVRVSLILSHSDNEYELVREISDVSRSDANLDKRFSNDRSTFRISKDGVILTQKEYPQEIERMVELRLCINVYWEQTTYIKKYGDERFIERYGPLLEYYQIPLIIFLPPFSDNLSKFEKWCESIKSSNFQALLFASDEDVVEDGNASIWVANLGASIGLLCMFFHSSSPKSTTIHWGENNNLKRDWLDQALGCGQAFYQASKA
jgi:hypothetical protein